MPTSFRGTVRYFRPEQGSGLTVVDLPPAVATELGGLKQLKVTAVVNGQSFDSNTMPAGGGRLALSLNKSILKAVGAGVGDEVSVSLAQRD